MELRVENINQIDKDLYISYYTFFTRVCGKTGYSKQNFDNLVNDKKISKLGEYFDTNLTVTTSALAKIKDPAIKVVAIKDNDRTVSYSRLMKNEEYNEVVVGEIALNYTMPYSDELYDAIIDALGKYVKTNYPEVGNVTFERFDNDTLLKNALDRNGFTLSLDGNYVNTSLYSKNVEEEIQSL